MKTFKELGLSKEFISVLEKANITIPSEIQEKTIPLALAGKDIIGGSATGSGKTLVFASTIIENLEKNGRVQALVLTPTRELAEQIVNAMKKFSTHKRLNFLSVYGGVNIVRQINALKNTDVVVGTPGRILDHLSRRTLDLGNVKFLVLDEVDRMFDMGFQVDVQKILVKCPKERQTLLFSATISQNIDYLAKKYTNKPVEISVKSHVDASKLKQVYYDVPDGLKFSLFAHLLKHEKAKLIMVFCGTRRNVEFITKNLDNLGLNVKAIHGGMDQNKRNKVLEEFNSDRGINVLVCTDVAARGLDIRQVSHVYNYDLPKTSEEYIHRIGRTARAGDEGIAINILSSRDYNNFTNIQRDEKLEIKKMDLPFLNRIEMIRDERKSYGQRDASRGRDPSRGNGRSGQRGRSKAGSSSDRRPNRNGFPGGTDRHALNSRMKGQRNDSKRSSSGRNSRDNRGNSRNRNSSRGQRR